MGVPAVWADGQDGGDALDAALREGTGLEAKARAKAEESPVGGRPGGQLEDAGRRRVAHPEVLVPGQLDPDGATQDQRGRGGERVRDEQLAAEPATERGARDADAGDRQAEQARQLGTRPERPLRRAREVEHAVAVQLGRRDLGLDIALVDPARREPALDDDVAGGQGSVHVTASEPRLRGDIRRHRLVGGERLGPATDGGMLRFGGRLGAIELPVDPGQRGTRRDRPIEVDHGVQWCGLDEHERRRVCRGLGRRRDDERDRLAGPQDLGPGERFVQAVAALGRDRQVGGGQDRPPRRGAPAPRRDRSARSERGRAGRGPAGRGAGRRAT